jgi:hydroxypyruvate isomerase
VLTTNDQCMKLEVSRRSMIKNVVATVSTGTLLSGFNTPLALGTGSLKGNINHSVCRWCFNDLSVDELCEISKRIGIRAIDLVGPKDWGTLKKHGIDSSMCNGAEINLVDGFNDPKFHAELVKRYTEMIPLVAKAGYKNLICFSGNRRGKDDETGIKNCTEGLKKVIGVAEKHGVTLVMELLNSKRDHADYQCDNTAFGVNLAKNLGSDNFKLLYDIYHMQVNEGNVIDTIRKNKDYIAHYHTAGVPGRHELTPDQELNYTAIMKAILETGFKGWVAQEYIPTGKSLEQRFNDLAKCVQVCDV